MTATTMHASEAALRATLTALADRWEQIAGAAAPNLSDDLFIDEPTVEQYRANERAHIYRKAASDLRDVLRTGRPPHDLMTDAELEQYGTPERAS